MRSYWQFAISLAWASVLILIFGRWLSLLLAADHESNIIQQAYAYSEFLLRPFFGLPGIDNQQHESGHIFEAAATVGFAVYFAAGVVVFAVSQSSLASHVARALAPVPIPAPALTDLTAEVAEPAPAEPHP
ncbi:MAG TPA: hypothetical protein VFB90_00315 [Dehalococcoidia bacterium]|nr:hypothetical protein [Dehalococcoidia bacterium]